MLTDDVEMGKQAMEIKIERDYYKAEAERHNAAANDLTKRCAYGFPLLYGFTGCVITDVAGFKLKL